MAIETVTMYKFVCDWNGCENTAQDGGEFSAWSNPDSAVGDASESGWWQDRSNEDVWYCQDHPARWSSDLEDGVTAPELPYLLIGDTDGMDDGLVKLVTGDE